MRTAYAEGSTLIPALRHAERRAAWSAARPLVGSGGAATGRELSRTFQTFDHAERDGVEGFVTITGGKSTTLRGMAELSIAGSDANHGRCDARLIAGRIASARGRG